MNDKIIEKLIKDIGNIVNGHYQDSGMEIDIKKLIQKALTLKEQEQTKI